LNFTTQNTQNRTEGDHYITIYVDVDGFIYLLILHNSDQIVKDIPNKKTYFYL